MGATNKKVIQAQPCLLGNTLAELGAILTDLGEKPYRAKQLYQWLYQKNAPPLETMSNLSAALRQKLAANYSLHCLELEQRLVSQGDGSVKYLWRLRDGAKVESVYMVEERRRTVCLSSQVGCPIGCIFCATGSMGWQRNLSAGEIVDQLLQINAHAPAPVTNIVFMGMGEPLLNYDNVIRAAQIFNSEAGPGIAARRITVSTAGLLPQIERYTAEGHPYKLAVSLNATTDELRRQLMPVSQRYTLRNLLAVLHNYTRIARKRVTFEYVMLAGVNDSLQDARRLVQLLSPIPCKLNLIPYNANPFFTFQPPDEEHLNAFIREVYRAPFAVTVRRSKGSDIAAACGQLYAANMPDKR